jgi:hypothetical protein
MDGALIVAIYAALVATASVAWQVFQWRQAHKNRPTVQVNLAMVPMSDGSVSGCDD